MEMHQLEAFEAVACHRSFTRAAQQLFVTQPAVTRQIAALEAELKCRLFERLGRTVRLTDAGEALHRYAEPIVRLAREAKSAVADAAGGRGGRLVVGASSTLATYVLPQILREFRTLHPQTEITISTGISAHIVERVRAGDVDMGLVTNEAAEGIPDVDKNHGPRLVVTRLADYETCVVVPPDHPLATAARITPADLSGTPLILMETGTNLRAYVDDLLGQAGSSRREKNGVAEQIAMELDNVEAIKRMIEAGLGISLLPEVAVRAEVASGRLCARPLHGVPHGKRRIALVLRADKYLSQTLLAFQELLVAGLKK